MPPGQLRHRIARTEDDPDLPQAANSAFTGRHPSEGWTEVRQVETMHGSTGHSEILHRGPPGSTTTRCSVGRGEGHLLGQCRLGPARRPLARAGSRRPRRALYMTAAGRTRRVSHGSILAEKQGVQWMIATSAMEVYQAKLMVLHAA